jgi:hypothetical protein
MADASFQLCSRKCSWLKRLGTLQPALTTIPLLVAFCWFWTCVLAVPAWLLWTFCGLGARYFSFLPPAWQFMPLHHWIGLALLLAILRTALTPPTFQLKA